MASTLQLGQALGVRGPALRAFAVYRATSRCRADAFILLGAALR